MFTYTADDINEATSLGLQLLLRSGLEETSRNGTVLVAPTPVCIEYANPRQRVLLSPTRDANPVFHLMETLWMLSGSNDITFPVFFSSTYGQFSDDGKTMWDAYGWRWREFFGYDQLETIVGELKTNPTSRRCVLAMWNGAEYTAGNGPDPAWAAKEGAWLQSDLLVAVEGGGKAVPCNTHAYFTIRDGELNMTVMNRSNDAMWGCFGANAVHFSFLLEYMAMRVGAQIGKYYQFTNNLHTYTDKFDIAKLNKIEHECDTVGVLPALGPALEEGFDEDLKLFMGWALRVIAAEPPPAEWPADQPVHPSTSLALDVPAMKTAFMHSVAAPIFLFWVYRKWKDAYSSNVCLNGIDAPDWQRACEEWAERRRR